MTKRIAGAKVGRPAKPKLPKPPKRSKGRPQVPLRDHPDRYTVARFDVAEWWLKEMVKGNRIRAAMVLGVDIVRQRQDVADMRKAADSLRTMARRYRKPADMEWRKAIGTAVAFTLLTVADPIANPNQLAVIVGVILDEAGSVGEEQWARRELLPLLTMEPSGSLLDLAAHDRLASLALIVAMIGWTTEVQNWMAARAAADDAQPGKPEMADIF